MMSLPKTNNSPSPTRQNRQVLRVSAKVIPKVNKYYLKISKRYRVTQIVLIAALLVYLVFVLSTFGSHITYDNLQYLVRDLDSMMSSGEGEFTKIQYDKQSEPNFAVFKNGVAAVGKESLTLFDSTGLQLCKDKISLNDPIPVPSEKYLLLYDMGGKSYSVYNSITRVVSRTTEHKIVDGDMSDSGAFILVLRGTETKYTVEHYNSALTPTMKIHKDNYVMDAAISKDGKRIAVCSAIPSGTDLDCEIALYQAGDKEFSHTVTLRQTMPLDVHFSDSGFAVLCDNGLYFYDMDGTEIAAHSLRDVTLEYADLSDHCTVLAGSENALGTENRIMVFDQNGTLTAETVLGKRLTGLSAPSEKDEGTLAYVLVSNSVLRLSSSDTGDLTWESADTEISDVLSLRPSQKGVIAFTDSTAYYLFN